MRRLLAAAGIALLLAIPGLGSADENVMLMAANQIMLLGVGGQAAICGPNPTGNLVTSGNAMLSGWTATRSTFTNNVTTDPCAGSAAASIVEDSTATNTHYIGYTISPALTASTTYTCDFYFKAGPGGDRDAELFISDVGFTNYEHVTFARADGSVSNGPTNVGNVTSTSTNSASAANSYWHVGATFNTGAGTTVNTLLIALWNAAGSYTGNGTSGIYVWGPSCRAGTSP